MLQRMTCAAVQDRNALCGRGEPNSPLQPLTEGVTLVPHLSSTLQEGRGFTTKTTDFAIKDPESPTLPQLNQLLDEIADLKQVLEHKQWLLDQAVRTFRVEHE